MDIAIILLIWLLLFAIVVGLIAFLIIANWKIYTKAGLEGWYSIVPFLNVWKLGEIAFGEEDAWKGLLVYIPAVGFVFSFLLYIGVARAFGKSDAFGILLIFCPIIGLPILGFSKDIEYVGPLVSVEDSEDYMEV